MALVCVELCKELVVKVFNINSFKNILELGNRQIFEYLVYLFVCAKECYVFKLCFDSIGKARIVYCCNVKLCKFRGKNYICRYIGSCIFRVGIVAFNLERDIVNDGLSISLYCRCIANELDLEAKCICLIINGIIEYERAELAAFVKICDLVKRRYGVEYQVFKVCNVDFSVIKGVLYIYVSIVDLNRTDSDKEGFYKSVFDRVEINNVFDITKGEGSELSLYRVKLDEVGNIDCINKTLAILLENLVQKLVHVEHFKNLIHGNG